MYVIVDKYLKFIFVSACVLYSFQVVAEIRFTDNGTDYTGLIDTGWGTPFAAEDIALQSTENIAGDSIVMGTSVSLVAGDRIVFSVVGTGITFANANYSLESSIGGAGTGDLTYGVFQSSPANGLTSIEFVMQESTTGGSPTALGNVGLFILSGDTIAGQPSLFNLPQVAGRDFSLRVEVFNAGDVSQGSSTTALFNSTLPAINSATYSVVTGDLAVTGVNFSANSGLANDVDVSTFTITGEGGATYTLIDSSDVEIANATDFIITLSSTDKIAVDALLNKNGTISQDSNVYNIAAADDFITAVTNNNTADLTGNAITVTAAPMISSATYNVVTGSLVVTGINFTANPGTDNDVDISLLTITGEDGSTHALTSTADVDITSASEFTVTLGGADKTAVDALLNKNGTSSVDGTAYNLAVADDFMTAFTDGNTADITGNAVTVADAPLAISNLRLKIAATVDNAVTEVEIQGQVFAVYKGSYEAVITVPATLTNIDVILRKDDGDSITKTIQLGEQ